MRALGLLVLLCGLPGLAWGQAAPATPAAEQTIDATKLGVSLSRIQKALRTAESKEKSQTDGLRIEYQVQVYGTAPRIEVLKDIDLVNGAVPGTAPTHRQLFDHLTPQIYRSPVMPLSAFAFWAAQHLVEKTKRARCEEEIANYRALVMQGVSVSAPRCTQ